MEYVADSNYPYPFFELQHVVYPSLYFSFLPQDDERTLEEEERMASDEGAGPIDEVRAVLSASYVHLLHLKRGVYVMFCVLVVYVGFLVKMCISVFFLRIRDSILRLESHSSSLVRNAKYEVLLADCRLIN